MSTLSSHQKTYAQAASRQDERASQTRRNYLPYLPNELMDMVLADATTQELWVFLGKESALDLLYKHPIRLAPWSASSNNIYRAIRNLRAQHQSKLLQNFDLELMYPCYPKFGWYPGTSWNEAINAFLYSFNHWENIKIQVASAYRVRQAGVVSFPNLRRLELIGRPHAKHNQNIHISSIDWAALHAPNPYELVLKNTILSMKAPAGYDGINFGVGDNIRVLTIHHDVWDDGILSALYEKASLTSPHWFPLLEELSLTLDEPFSDACGEAVDLLLWGLVDCTRILRKLVFRNVFTRHLAVHDDDQVSTMHIPLDGLPMLQELEVPFAHFGAHWHDSSASEYLALHIRDIQMGSDEA